MLSFLRQLSTWHCSHLLWSAVPRRRCCWAPAVQQSIDISCLRGAQQQTRSSGVRPRVGSDGETDGRTNPHSWPHTVRAVAITWRVVMYRVGRKSKLLILSERVNKTEKTDEHEQIRTATEKMNYCLIFSREIFYVTDALCLNILWLKAVNEITAVGKHELASGKLKKSVATRINVANIQVLDRSQNYRIFNFRTIV